MVITHEKKQKMAQIMFSELGKKVLIECQDSYGSVEDRKKVFELVEQIDEAMQHSPIDICMMALAHLLTKGFSFVVIQTNPLEVKQFYTGVRVGKN
jgi:hypothetical protein